MEDPWCDSLREDGAFGNADMPDRSLVYRTRVQVEAGGRSWTTLLRPDSSGFMLTEDVLDAIKD